MQTQESKKSHNTIVISSSTRKQTNKLSKLDTSRPTSNPNNTITTDYIKALTDWLHQHKKYPRKAARRGIEGTVLVTFVMNARNQVTHYQIDKSSGSTLLDKATLAIFTKPKNLPMLPQQARGSQYTFTIPISYKLH